AIERALGLLAIAILARDHAMRVIEFERRAFAARVPARDRAAGPRVVWDQLLDRLAIADGRDLAVGVAADDLDERADLATREPVAVVRAGLRRQLGRVCTLRLHESAARVVDDRLVFDAR